MVKKRQNSNATFWVILKHCVGVLITDCPNSKSIMTWVQQCLHYFVEAPSKQEMRDFLDQKRSGRNSGQIG